MNINDEADKSANKKNYKILVDNEKVEFNKPEVSGEEILVKVGKTPPDCFSLYQKFKDCDFEKIGLKETVNLEAKGLEKFTVKEPEVFKYFLDDEPETTDQKSLTANQILENGGITPVSDYFLTEVDKDRNNISHKDTPDLPIEMKCPGSRFVSIFRGPMPVS